MLAPLLEVFQNNCLRSGLPARLQKRDIHISGVDLRRRFGIAAVATLLVRRQLRWLGHLARMDETRIPARMTSAGRGEAGMGARGCRGESLLGVFGGTGMYNKLVQRHLTWSARHTHFDGARGQWWVLAQNRDGWKAFVGSVVA